MCHDFSFCCKHCDYLRLLLTLLSVCALFCMYCGRVVCLVLFVIFVLVLWLLAAGFFVLCPVRCLTIMFRRFCDHLVREEGIVCFAFKWFVTYVPSVVVCLLFLLGH